MIRLLVPRVVLSGLALLSVGHTSVAAQSSLAGASGRVLTAVRVHHPPRIDGRLDEPDWATAPVATQFVQRFPDPGRAATYQTEVRILYDDDAVYVGARMFDPHPDSIAAPLARRDPGDVSSDWFDVIFDSYHDHRTGFRFAVNPAGTRIDDYHFNDGDDDPSWDAYWDVATRVDSVGWTAEFRIPLSQLRFRGTPGEQTWGLNFYRAVARRGEWTFWSPYPPSAPGFVSSFGELRGLVGLSTASPLELEPYVSSRVRAGGQPQDSPFNRPAHSAASVGAALRLGIGSALSLSATVNPDFGQVEVDPAVINLTTMETFFPEKRPFFLEGAGIFDFGTLPYYATYGASKLLHWRRIGRDPQLAPSATWSETPEPAPILGAAKVSGQLGGGWSIGVLDALTGRETVRFADSAGVTGRATVEPLTNYLVARLKRDFDDGRTTLGLLGTSTQRSLDTASAGVLRAHAAVAGMDFTHATASRRWLFGASLAESQVGGTASAMAATQRSSVRYYGRPDAAYLPLDSTRRTLAGYDVSAGAVYQGDPWFGSLALRDISPGFESNDLGYLPRADARSVAAAVGLQRNSSRGPLREMRASISGQEAWNHGGQNIWGDAGIGGSLQLSNFWRAGARVELAPSLHDDRLTRGGPTVLVPSLQRVTVSIDSDDRRRLRGSGFFYGVHKALGGFERMASGALIGRPAPSVQLTLGPSLDLVREPSQFVTAIADPLAVATYGMRYVFATLDQRTLSADVRFDWTITPDLSVQLYAQPLRSRASYTSYKELLPGATLAYAVYGRDRGIITPLSNARYEIDPDGAGSASPFTVGASPSEASFASTSRRVNVVLRREFRNGAVAYLVWQQIADRTVPLAAGAPPDLWSPLPMSNVVMAKFSYRLGR